MINRRGVLVGMATGLALLPLPVAGAEAIDSPQSTREMAEDLVSMETAYAMAMTENPQAMAHYFESWDA